MTLEMGILLMELISRGVDSGMKLKIAYDTISKMNPDEVQQAIGNAEAQTVILMEVARGL